jgi:hypothetical protein
MTRWIWRKAYQRDAAYCWPEWVDRPSLYADWQVAFMRQQKGAFVTRQLCENCQSTECEHYRAFIAEFPEPLWTESETPEERRERIARDRERDYPA